MPINFNITKVEFQLRGRRHPARRRRPSNGRTTSCLTTFFEKVFEIVRRLAGRRLERLPARRCRRL